MLHSRLDLCVNHNRIVAMYFFASLTFLVLGLSLCSVLTPDGPMSVPPGYSGPVPHIMVHGYADLGLSLYGFGIFLVAATFYQSLVGEKKNLLNGTQLA
jgi:hypothetical protein